MSLKVMCELGELFLKIVENCEETGDLSSELLATFIYQLEIFEGSKKHVQKLKTLLQLLKQKENDQLQDEEPTSFLASFKKLFQPDTTGVVRAVKPPIEVFVNELRSFLTSNERVRHVLKELGAEIGEQMIDKLKQQGQTQQHASTETGYPSPLSPEQDLIDFFRSIQNDCEK